jgi:hypothetical protein
MSQSITIQNNVHLDHLLSTYPEMEKYMRTAIAYVMEQARKDVVGRLQSEIPNDPRHAYKAVRKAIYKKIFGANLNILSKKRSGNTGTITPSTRGRTKHTEQILGYEGEDRGFILRFLNAGTQDRIATNMNGHSIKRKQMVKHYTYRSGHIGGRGRIEGKDFFGPSATAAINEAIPLLINEMNRIITEQSNK